MLAKTHCPGCHGSDLGTSVIWASQPVILNYRFATAEEACGVARRDMDLRQCGQCGLIFNATLDEAIIPYDERYENRQSCSPTFSGMMKDIAGSLAHRYALKDGLVMEVGCGKGEFLKLLCDIAQARGAGYDTSCEEEATSTETRVKFFKRYATEADATGTVDAVVCRHVVEHVSSIGDFLGLLAGIARTGSSRVVYIETPAWEWIVENEAFWDVFYEHCNYFPMPTLRYLAELAGFEVLAHRAIFGCQYQALELRAAAPAAPAAVPPGVQASASLRAFSDSVAESRLKLRERLLAAGAEKGWAVWGAGAKGVSLVNTFPDMAPAFVVDSNAAKQGSYIPGTAVPVVAPDDARLAGIGIVLIANPNYLEEIRRTLALQGLSPILITV